MRVRNGAETIRQGQFLNPGGGPRVQVYSVGLSLEICPALGQVERAAPIIGLLRPCNCLSWLGLRPFGAHLKCTAPDLRPAAPIVRAVTVTLLFWQSNKICLLLGWGSILLIRDLPIEMHGAWSGIRHETAGAKPSLHRTKSGLARVAVFLHS